MTAMSRPQAIDDDRWVDVDMGRRLPFPGVRRAGGPGLCYSRVGTTARFDRTSLAGPWATVPVGGGEERTGVREFSVPVTTEVGPDEAIPDMLTDNVAQHGDEVGLRRRVDGMAGRHVEAVQRGCRASPGSDRRRRGAGDRVP